MSVTSMTAALKGKGLAHTMALIATVAAATFFATVKLVSEVRRVEKTLDARFVQIDKRIDSVGADMNKRSDTIQAQLDLAWTIHMQSIRDMMVASKNTNNWIPDAYRIFEAVRHGKVPDAIRITP